MVGLAARGPVLLVDVSQLVDELLEACGLGVRHADDHDRVVAGDAARDVGQARVVDGGGHALGGTRLRVDPTFKKHSIILNPKGITFPCFLTSPIITAHIFPFFRTLYDSAATLFILSKNLSTQSNEMSPDIPLLYLIISAYGG